jgi:hypothetical protein
MSRLSSRHIADDLRLKALLGYSHDRLVDCGASSPAIEGELRCYTFRKLSAENSQVRNRDDNMHPVATWQEI